MHMCSLHLWNRDDEEQHSAILLWCIHTLTHCTCSANSNKKREHEQNDEAERKRWKESEENWLCAWKAKMRKECRGQQTNKQSRCKGIRKKSSQPQFLQRRNFSFFFSFSQFSFGISVTECATAENLFSIPLFSFALLYFSFVSFVLHCVCAVQFCVCIVSPMDSVGGAQMHFTV